MRRACRFPTRPSGERWRGLRRGSSRWCPSERERNETNVRRALAAPQGCSTSPASRRPAATSVCSCRAAARSRSRREERESERASEQASEGRARESERGSSERKGARVERERASEDRARDDDTIKKRETPPVSDGSSDEDAARQAGAVRLPSPHLAITVFVLSPPRPMAVARRRVLPLARPRRGRRGRASGVAYPSLSVSVSVEGVVSSVVPPPAAGGRILVVSNGAYGRRMAQMCAIPRDCEAPP